MKLANAFPGGDRYGAFISVDAFRSAVRSRAIADEITKRLNAHDALMAALERAFISLGRAGGNHAEGDPAIRAAWLDARAVLAGVQS